MRRKEKWNEKSAHLKRKMPFVSVWSAHCVYCACKQTNFIYSAQLNSAQRQHIHSNTHFQLMANTSFRIASLNRVYHYISLAAFVLFELFFLCVRSHSIMQSSSIVRACAIWLFRTENYCTHVQRCTISTRSLSLSGALFFISNFTIFRYFLLSCHGIENVRQSGWKRKDWERERDVIR